MKLTVGWGLSCLLFVLLLETVVCQEKNIGALVTGLKSREDTARKEALAGLLERANYEHAAKELDKRGVVPLLIKILQEENGNPLIKESAVAVLAKMTLHSTQVSAKLLESEFISICDKLVRKGTTTSLEHIITVLTHVAALGPTQRSILAGSASLNALLFVLKSGTPIARERAAHLVSELSQDETARHRLAELDVDALLRRITEIGTANGKKHAANAIRKLQQPIQQLPQAKTTVGQSTSSQQSTSGQPTSGLSNVLSHMKMKESVDVLDLLGIDFSHDGSNNENGQSTPKKKNGFVNNYRLRAPTRSSHI